MPSANLGIAKSQWATVMSKIHKGLKVKEFPESQYAVERYYCTKTGGLATEECKKTAVGWYKKSNLPETCHKHSGTLMKTPEEVEKEKEKEDKEKESKETATSENG